VARRAAAAGGESFVIEQIIWATGLVIIGAMGLAYYKYRDPLHPLMYLGPMLFYVYAFVPATMFYRGTIGEFFQDESKLIMAQMVNLVSLVLFCVGCLGARLPGRAQRFLAIPFKLKPETRHRLVRASYLVAAAGLGPYFLQTVQGGGLSEMFSGAKGGSIDISSGYVAEAPLLTIPATMLYLLSRTGRKLDFKTVALMLFFNIPHLLYAILGARRGPAFMVFATLVFGWYVAGSRRPALRTVAAWMLGIGVLMMFLISHRKQIYIGSEFQFDQAALTEAIVPSKTTVGDTTVYAWGLIIASDFNNRHFWGRRYACQLLIRPIPRQIWPTKYEDTGMKAIVELPGSGGLTSAEWFSALGWIPDAGSASGFVADAYIEFSWGGAVVCYLMGLFYGYLWRKSVIEKGIFSLLYIELAIVSVYVPTQGVCSAWFYRFLLLAAPTYLVWKWLNSRWSLLPRPDLPPEDEPRRRPEPVPRIPPRIIPSV
jgi:oligosaccharide repeat unit polymerase